MNAGVRKVERQKKSCFEKFKKQGPNSGFSSFNEELKMSLKWDKEQAQEREWSKACTSLRPEYSKISRVT